VGTDEVIEVSDGGVEEVLEGGFMLVGVGLQLASNIKARQGPQSNRDNLVIDIAQTSAQGRFPATREEYLSVSG